MAITEIFVGGARRAEISGSPSDVYIIDSHIVWHAPVEIFPPPTCPGNIVSCQVLMGRVRVLWRIVARNLVSDGSGHQGCSVEFGLPPGVDQYLAQVKTPASRQTSCCSQGSGRPSIQPISVVISGVVARMMKHVANNKSFALNIWSWKPRW